MAGVPHMTKSIISSIAMGRERYVMAETVVRLCEGFRADYTPHLLLWDAFTLLVILRKMVDNSINRRISNATNLARALSMPRTTVHRRLAQLKEMGAVEQHGAQYTVVPAFMNHPKMIEGFERRRDYVGASHKKMLQSGT